MPLGGDNQKNEANVYTYIAHVLQSTSAYVILL